MAIRTLTPIGFAFPGQGTELQTEPRVNKAQFGDGYVQRSGDGINILERKGNVTFSALTDKELQYLIAFFEEHKGYIAFLWTFPGDKLPQKWIATSWKRGAIDYNVQSLSVSIEKVYDQ